MVKPPKLPSGRGIPLHADSIQYWGEQQKQLRRDLRKWNQFRSSLDAIRQTHRAIEAYNHSNGELTDDQRYLAIYGLLQALVVQQDAMCHLAEALGTKPVHMARHKRLEEIRNIRNWTVGHPTKIDRYNTYSHHAIKRTQLGRGGFSLYSAFDDGREQYTYVPLLQLARLQRRVVSRLLRDMLRELNSRRHATNKVTAPRSNSTNAQPTNREQQRGQNRERRAEPVRSSARKYIGPGRKPWDGGQSRFGPGRDGKLHGRQRRTPKHGTPQQKPPQFATPALSHKSGRKGKKSKRPQIGLLPLPGEKFARQWPAA